MLDETALVAAFTAKLDTVSGIPDSDHRATENIEFDPEIDVIWLRETLIIAEESKTAIGQVEASGDMQYDLMAPTGTGTAAIRTLAKAVVETFEGIQALSGGGMDIIIENSERLPGRQDFGEDRLPSLWYYIPVLISWRVFSLSSV